MHLRKPDDSYQKVKINTEQPYPDTEEQGKMLHFPTDKGDHHVTISTGPAYASVQEEYKDLLQGFASKPEAIPQAGTPAAKIVAKLIKAMNLGIKGDEVADILDPQDEEEQMPPQAQQAIQQMQQEHAALNQYAQQLEAQVKEMQQKIDAKVIDNAAKKDIEQMKIEAQVTVAEINTKAQNMSERLSFIEDILKQFQIHKHEAEMQAGQQNHEAGMANQNAQIADQQQAAQGAQQQA